jgi:hypothetical protein
VKPDVEVPPQPPDYGEPYGLPPFDFAIPAF